MNHSATRRHFLASTAALGLGSLFASPGSMAQGAPQPLPDRKRIDVHHHILPPEYVAKVGTTAIGAPAPNRGTPSWTVERSLAAMNENGIASAMVSVSAPGLWFDDARLAKYLARSANTFAAQMMADHPGRFGSFASLPLPDVAAALEEIRHAFDTLHCDGVVLMTNYGDRYLGDPGFAPVFDELNARGATVYVHPTSCNCSLGVMSEIPASMIEFPHDSTRTVVSLLYGGVFSRCPRIKFIFSHAGGTLPYLAHRIALLGKLDKAFNERVPEGVMAVLRRLHFDTALSANDIAIPALLKLVSARNILIGTDFPFAPEAAMRMQLEGLYSLGLADADLHAIERDNAVRIFTRLAGA